MAEKYWVYFKDSSRRVLFGEDTEQQYPLFLQNIVHLIRHGKQFITNINSTIRTKYIDHYGTGVKPKQFPQNNTHRKCVNMEVISIDQESKFEIDEKVSLLIQLLCSICWIYGRRSHRLGLYV